MFPENKNQLIRVPDENIDQLILQEGVNAYVIIDDILPRFPEKAWLRKEEEDYESRTGTLLKKLDLAIQQIEKQGGKYLGFRDDIVLVKNPNWAEARFPHRIISVIASK